MVTTPYDDSIVSTVDKISVLHARKHRLCLSNNSLIIIFCILSESGQAMHVLIPLFAFLLSLTHATPLHTPRVDYLVHEWQVEHPTWTRMRRLEEDVTLPLRIGLKQRNLDVLPDFLMSVSDPDSPSYGQHWTPEKVVETFAPAPEAVDRVYTWLVEAGFGKKRVRRSANRAWIEVKDATAGEVERLLDARYHVYKREEGGEHFGVHVPCPIHS